MAESIVKTCPECRQLLRIPKNIGGVVMACPSCGKQFYSDFKVGGAENQEGNTADTIFEMPSTLRDTLSHLISS